MIHNLRVVVYRCLCICCVIGLCASGTCQARQSSRDRRDEKRENERVREAEQQLNEAKKKASEAQSKVRAQFKVVSKAQQSTIESKKRLRSAEEAAEKEFGKEYGVPEAMERVKAARADLDKCAAPVIKRTQSSDEWKEANAKAQEARSQRDAILDNETLDEKQRDLALKENSQTLTLPGILEERAVRADKECAEAQTKLTGEVEELDARRAKVSRDKIQSHPKVAKARKEVDACVKEESQEEKELTSLQSSLSRAQKSLADAQAKLQKAKLDDAKDPNRGGKKSK